MAKKDKGKSKSASLNYNMFVYVFYLFVFLFFLAMGIVIYNYGSYLNPLYSPVSIMLLLNSVLVISIILRHRVGVNSPERKGFYGRKLIVGLLLGLLFSVLQGGLSMVVIYQLLIVTIIFDRVTYLLTARVNFSELLSVIVIVSTGIPLMMMIGIPFTITFIASSLGLFYLYSTELRSLVLK